MLEVLAFASEEFMEEITTEGFQVLGLLGRKANKAFAEVTQSLATKVL